MSSDERFLCSCPLRRKTLPTEGPCPLGVERLRWMKSLSSDPTPEQEKTAPGCPWYIKHARANYCFFLFDANYSKNIKLTDSDANIANLLSLGPNSVKDTIKAALHKLGQDEELKEVVESMTGLDAPENRLEHDDLFDQ